MNDLNSDNGSISNENITINEPDHPVLDHPNNSKNPSLLTKEFALQVNNVVKQYNIGPKKVQVLKKINYLVENGKIYAIMGPSGAGKSTLLNVIGGLDRFEEGKILVAGVEISKLSNYNLAKYRNRHIGFIFQSHNLLKEFTALENVAMPLLIRRIKKKNAYDQAKQILSEVNLDHRLTHRPSELSGGEAQRVAVARALVTNPQLVLADEPTGNLDTENSQNLMELLLNLQQKHKQTIILVTHDPFLAQKAHITNYLVDGQFQDQP